jgi:hypothetical protein
MSSVNLIACARCAVSKARCDRKVSCGVFRGTSASTNSMYRSLARNALPEIMFVSLDAVHVDQKRSENRLDEMKGLQCLPTLLVPTPYFPATTHPGKKRGK